MEVNAIDLKIMVLECEMSDLYNERKKQIETNASEDESVMTLIRIDEIYDEIEELYNQKYFEVA